MPLLKGSLNKNFASQCYAPYEVQNVDKSFTPRVTKTLQLKIKQSDESKKSNVDLGEEYSIPAVDVYDSPAKTFGPTGEAKRHKIKSSLRKLRVPVKSILGKHVLDARLLLGGSDLKSAKYLFNLLEAARRNAANNGLDTNRLYVKDVLYGRASFKKRLMIRGRGRADVQNLPFCHIHIVVHEKPLEEFFTSLLEGNASEGFAAHLRDQLRRQEVDYATIRNYQFILTAKGRQQRRHQLKRRVEMQLAENQRTGIYLSREKVRRNILREEVKDMIASYQERRAQTHLEGYEKRMEVFKRNQKNSD